MRKKTIIAITKGRFMLKALLNIFSIHLGDDVVYKGEKYFINNGVSAPVWDLLSYAKPQKHIRIHQKDFKCVVNIKRLIERFKSDYRFYVGYWLDILVDQFPKRAWDSLSGKQGF